MRVTAPDGTVYDIARTWAGTELGRLGARWTARIKRYEKFGRAEKALDLGTASDLFGEIPGVVVVIVAIIMIVLILAVAVPLVLLLAGLVGQLVWLLLLLPVAFAWKVIAKRPWRIEVRRLPDEVAIASHSVVGFQEAGRVERDAATQIEEGSSPEDVFRSIGA